MLLGEARSKVEHVARSLLRPDVADEMHRVYLAKGVLATTAIEGNTLSEEEVRELLQDGLHLPPSREYLAREIRNIVAAYNEIGEQLIQGTAPNLSPDLLADYNRAILEGLALDDGVVPGEIPSHPVVVGRYRAPPREDRVYLLGRFCEWMNGPDFVAPDPSWAVPYAILKAIVAHLYLAWIHPYGDGNGRTARLIEFRILLEAGVPTPAAHLLSNHYNQTRTDYYRRLDTASRSGDGAFEFVAYALQGFVDGLRDQLRLVREQQFKDRWEQYIYETFGGRSTAADGRRCELVLELSKQAAPVSKGDLPRLSPELAVAYARKTSKTLTRDVNALKALGLIVGSSKGYEPNRHVIEAFMPLTPGASNDAD